MVRREFIGFNKEKELQLPEPKEIYSGLPSSGLIYSDFKNGNVKMETLQVYSNANGLVLWSSDTNKNSINITMVPLNSDPKNEIIALADYIMATPIEIVGNIEKRENGCNIKITGAYLYDVYDEKEVRKRLEMLKGSEDPQKKLLYELLEKLVGVSPRR